MASSKSGKTEESPNSPEKQISVLEKMIEKSSVATEPRQFNIHELSSLTGHDEREIQRSLYILEGHKYVSPCPPGDFTSKVWQLTKDGMSALDGMTEESAVRML